MVDWGQVDSSTKTGTGKEEKLVSRPIEMSRKRRSKRGAYGGKTSPDGPDGFVSDHNVAAVIGKERCAR